MLSQQDPVEGEEKRPLNIHFIPSQIYSEEILAIEATEETETLF